MKMLTTSFAALAVLVIGCGIGAAYAGIITTYAINCALGSLLYWASSKIRNLVIRMGLIILAVMTFCTALTLVIVCL